ncbi:capsular biosynthesis protein [Bacillus sp. SB49]|uniref:YveK family protein n=1 Tax=Bacillus sp. SB49 TaxID=1071080 RepID=UPI0004237B2F|nr:Wzz/FepE/Etk N-terminal domain-containing protein [Bacillus sp. SB49]QHT48032.1 capsular biosynthesis protein [Bacillus sp. SB49]
MEETISLKEIFEVIKKRIWLIIALAVGAAVLSAAYTIFLVTPTYESSSQFIVNQSQEQKANAAYDINEIRTNVELINTYNVIIESPRILDRVAEELNLDLSAEALSSKITVANAAESQVVNVTATDANALMAADIANTTVEIFKEEVPTLMNGVDNIQVLTEASVGADPAPVSPNTTLNIAIALVVGLMLGVGIAFLLEYLDNTVKSEQDIDDILDLPVLGVVTTISPSDMVQGRSNKKQLREVRGESVGT